MTAASGGSGEQPPGEGGQPESGGWESPPIEEMPAYGDWPPPAPPAAPPPGYGAYPPPPPGYGAYPPPPPGYPSSPPGYLPPPEYGAPYPGYAGYPPDYPAGRPGLNALSIVALVSSVLWVCGLGSVAGVVLGGIALNQIKRSGERGYGLAVAGIVVGVLGIVAALISITFTPSMG